jgi:ferrous iron transport protein A
METSPLSCLRAGETALVAWIDGNAEFVTRLAEMGFREGSTIRMIQPGSPCILDLGGQRLSLRLESNTEVFVELASSETLSV